MSEFKKTRVQELSVNKLSGTERNVLLYGGSRSGKTFSIIRAIVIRAIKEQSRHVVLRQHFNHVKTSIVMDTFPKVMKLCFPELKYEINKSDLFASFQNGSEIWFAGLDDDSRTEKILGKEYSTLFFNECSQINYDSVQIALTRLAEKNGLSKKAYYDCNPPTKRHWVYWQFIKNINPKDNMPIKKENYACMLMNPMDNVENIDSDYITEILDNLPEKQRMRFKEGIFLDDDDGCAYYEFNRDRHVKECSRTNGTLLVGMDFNVMPMTATICQYVNEKFYVFDEIFLENSDTFKMSKELRDKGFGGAKLYPDSTGANRKTSGISDHEILRRDGFTIESVRNPLQVDRVNNVNRLLKEDRLIISPKCRKLISDLERVSWKDGQLDQKTDKMLTHISDSLGYLLWKMEPIRPHRPTTGIQL